MYKGTLKLIQASPFVRWLFRITHKVDAPELRREVMDMSFRGPVGLASGFDPRGEYYNAVASMGCSFEIIGPLYYSREGGIKSVVTNLQRCPLENLNIGINITKLPGSHSEQDITRDYLESFTYVYDFVDFAVLNFSDDSIGSVHELAFIKDITDPILDARLSYESYRPVLIRLSPTLSREDLAPILDYCLMNRVDGVLASGETLIRNIYELTKGRLPIVGVGHIRTVQEATVLLNAGATLIALESPAGNYHPALPKAILKSLLKK